MAIRLLNVQVVKAPALAVTIFVVVDGVVVIGYMVAPFALLHDNDAVVLDTGTANSDVTPAGTVVNETALLADPPNPDALDDVIANG